MREAQAIVYNFSQGRPVGEMLAECAEEINKMEKAELIVDEIIIKFSEKPTFQSDPEEGNLPKKQ